MRGKLFDDYEVELHYNTEKLGGAWQGGRDDKDRLIVWDSDLLKFFHARMMKVSPLRYLDVGANTGSFCLLAKFHPDARCVAFEPAWDAYTVLKYNIGANDLRDRVQPYHAAVMDYEGMGTLRVPQSLGEAGLATLAKSSRFKLFSQQEVKCVRLDDIGLTGPIDIIKIDVEGAEIRVLQGAVGIIDLYKPAILLEYQDGTRDFGYERPAITQMLGGFGYDRYSRVGKGDLWCTHPQSRTS